MKAIIMAGGEGSRLRPLTCENPKPMVPVLGIPMIEHIINLLIKHGITDIGITLMFMPQKIKDYLGNGSSFGVDITYFLEEAPLGTAGSVKNAESFLDDTFIVISGDSLTDINLTDAIEFHKAKKSLVTLILKQVDVPLEYGVVLTNENDEITGFLEKPSWSEVFSDTANTGTYILEPEILRYIIKDTKTDFSQDVFPQLLNDSMPLYGYITNSYWCDIGDLSAYIQAHYDILDNKLTIETKAKELRSGIWVGEDTHIEPNAEIIPPCFIGSNCRIGNGTVIDSYSIISDNTEIEDEVSIKRSIIWDGCSIGFGSEMRGSILCSRVVLKHYTSIFENAAIGESCTIHERSIIKPNIKIWPHKVIDPLSIVDRNIIWSVKHSKTLFGDNGISGIINVDISPEFSARLGAAYGSIFTKGTKVFVSSTTDNSARMFKHAFASGMLSVGVEVYNLSSLLTPIARHAITVLGVSGGIHLKIDEYNPNRIIMDFMDSRGSNIDRSTERKIENAYFKEDFKRSSFDEISRLNNLTDYKNYYIRALSKEVDKNLIQSKKIRICFYSPSDFVVSVLLNMSSEIGCEVAAFHTSSLQDMATHLQELDTVDADFAAFIDTNAENLVLLDRFGNIVKDEMFQAMVSLILFKSIKNSKIVIPITAPSIIEVMAERYNCTVLRTKRSNHALMEHLLSNDHVNKKNNSLQFMLQFDALASLAKIIEFMCLNEITLTELIDEIPDFYIRKKKVFCPWEMKGRVMRTLISEQNSEQLELLEGVKFQHNNGWALVLPDADMPLCRIYCEGDSPSIAEKILEMYTMKIDKIISEP